MDSAAKSLETKHTNNSSAANDEFEEAQEARLDPIKESVENLDSSEEYDVKPLQRRSSVDQSMPS